MITNGVPGSSSEGTIPVKDAKNGVENWEAYLESSNQKFNVKSYEIPIVSFQNLLGNNPDAESVKIYIGLANSEDPTSSQIYMVPIINGHEKLFRLTPPGNAPGDPKDDSNVYDMSKSCPPDCGNGGGPWGTLGK